MPIHPLSLLFPTYGRPELIWETVRLFLKQLEGEDEILIIDQNSPPLKIPDNMAEYPIRLIRLENPGLTRARNLGLGEARHDFLLFLDDDIVPAEDLLATFREAIALDAGSIWAGAVDQNDMPTFQGIGFVDLNTGEIRTRFDFRSSEDLPFFAGGHTLFPRSVLPFPKVFCEHYRGSALGEEIDLAIRLKNRGIRIRALPQARVFHLKAPSGGCRADGYQKKFHFDHCFNEAMFFGRHGHLFSLHLFLMRIKGFLEFHTRKPKGGHSLIQVLRCLANLAFGLLQGLMSRPNLMHESKSYRLAKHE